MVPRHVQELRTNVYNKRHSYLSYYSGNARCLWAVSQRTMGKDQIYVRNIFWLFKWPHICILYNHNITLLPAVPNLSGPRDWLHGRKWFHRRGRGRTVSGWFRCIAFQLTSCCAAHSLTGPNQYPLKARRLGTPALYHTIWCLKILYKWWEEDNRQKGN